MNRVFLLALSAALLLSSPGSADVTGTEQVLGGGVAITLPNDMKLKPNPNLFKMKDVEQWDYRLRSTPVSIALTGVGFEVPKDVTPGKLDTRALIVRGMAQYLSQSEASEIQSVAFENGRVSGHHATLRAKEGAVFAIGFDLPRRCVTTAVISAGVHGGKSIAYTATIGSDDCNSPAHVAAVAGVAGMRPL